LERFNNSPPMVKFGLIGALALIGITLCCCLIVLVSNIVNPPTAGAPSATPGSDTTEEPSATSPAPTTEPTVAATSTIEPSTVQATTAAPAAIPGLNPADVTVNLEERGFTCSGPELGELYYHRVCEGDETSLVHMVVEIYGRELFTVDYISATVFQFVDQPSDELSGTFLGYLATLPYDGATPEEARAWVEETLPTVQGDGGTQSTTFGGVPYELLGPPTARILTMGRLE
jgi:hypothetical protein